MHRTSSENRRTDLPIVSIRTGFLAGLRHSPRWTMTVRSADGVLLARQRFSTFQEAVAGAHIACREAADQALELAA